MTSKGIEADITWLVDNNHKISAAVALLDATYDSFAGATCFPGQDADSGCVGGVQDLSGDEVQYSPDNQYNLAVDGRYPTVSDLEWGWRASYSWRSDQFIGSKNSPGDIQESYGKVNASVFVEGQDARWRVSLIGLNLSDEITGNFANDTREPRAFDPDVLPRAPSFFFTSPGRQIAIQGRYNF